MGIEGQGVGDRQAGNEPHAEGVPQVPFDRKVRFDPETYQTAAALPPTFRFKHLPNSSAQPPQTNFDHCTSPEIALHRLMIELMDLQEHAIRLALGSTNLKKFIVEGGFAQNDLYLQLLKQRFPDVQIETAEILYGAARGAAMIMLPPPV